MSISMPRCRKFPPATPQFYLFLGPHSGRHDFGIAKMTGIPSALLYLTNHHSDRLPIGFVGMLVVDTIYY